jgi:hypothetical protein
LAIVITFKQGGKALIAGVWFNNQLIVVSDVGVKTISLLNLLKVKPDRPIPLEEV